MTNKERFFACCKTLANIETAIDILESVGVTLAQSYSENRNTFSDLIHEVSDEQIDVAMSFLSVEEWHYQDYDDVYNDILRARHDNYFKIATEVWNQYGIE